MYNVINLPKNVVEIVLHSDFFESVANKIYFQRQSQSFTADI